MITTQLYHNNNYVNGSGRSQLSTLKVDLTLCNNLFGAHSITYVSMYDITSGVLSLTVTPALNIYDSCSY